MPYSGYPTPDIDPNQEFVNVCVTIPSSVSDVFYSILLGQIGEMADGNYWKQEGTMTPEDCAFLWSQTLAITSANLEGCVTVPCETVADCIENDTSVQDAIATATLNSANIQNAIETVVQVSSGSGSNPNPDQQLPASILQANFIPATALCTENNKYAMARAIVQELDDLSTDFLDVIAVISENAEIASEMVQSIPIFGGLASLALTGANFINNNIRTQYVRAYNSTTELDFTCAIWCAFNGCELNWDLVYDAIAEGTQISPPTDTDFTTVITWFANNVIGSTDNIIVGSMHLFVLSCLKYGSDWFGSGVYTTLEIQVEDASDEEITVPASCSCASTGCVEWDFTASQQWLAINFANNNFSGRPNSGAGNAAAYNANGWNSVDYTAVNASTYRQCGIQTTDVNSLWSLPIGATRIEIDIDLTKGVVSGAEQILSVGTYAANKAATTRISLQSSGISDGIQTLSADFDADIHGIYAIVRADSGANLQGSSLITKVRLYYDTGTPVSGAPCV